MPFRLLFLCLIAAGLWGQAKLDLELPQRAVRPYVRERLSSADKTLFDKPARAPLEAVWSQLAAKGRPRLTVRLRPRPENRARARSRRMPVVKLKSDLRNPKG